MNNEPTVRPKVFVSYAREDGATLAEELIVALNVLGFDGYLDRHDIVGAEEWERRLDMLIRQADTVIFVLSPESVRSERCDWEVQKARELSKKIVPVIGVPVEDDAVPEELQRLQYVYFTPGHSFATSLGQLADTLRLDINWVREHTRIGELAERWRMRNRPDALLLRGEELSSAQAWSSKWQPALPQITELHRSFIAASDDAAKERESLERRRNEEVALANTQRSEALARREEAVRSMKRRTLLGGALAGSLSLALCGVGLYSYGLRSRVADAEVARKEAEERSFDQAIRKEALRRDLTGQVVAYAASRGQVAMDTGPGGHSPYTGALLKELDASDVSLWSALSKASTAVSKQTNGAQRPFISSDMNGDIFLKVPSATRRCKAIVVGASKFPHVNLAEGVEFTNVPSDAARWSEFLRKCNCDVTLLLEPLRLDVLNALNNSRFATAEIANFAIRPVGISTGMDPPEAAPADTLVIFFYAGLGFSAYGERYIAVLDTGREVRNTGAVRASAISVNQLERMLRQRAAASVLVFDTDFEDWAIKEPKKRL